MIAEAIKFAVAEEYIERTLFLVPNSVLYHVDHIFRSNELQMAFVMQSDVSLLLSEFMHSKFIRFLQVVQTRTQFRTFMHKLLVDRIDVFSRCAVCLYVSLQLA